MSTGSIVADESAQHDDAEDQLIIQEEEQQELDPRAVRMAEIAANRNKERTEESGEILEDNEEDESLEITLDEPDPVTPTQKAEPKVFERDGQFFATLKVNGVEVEQPIEKVLAVAQKHESADSRLNDAAAYDQRLQQKEASLNQREQNLGQQQPETSSKQLSEQDAAERKSLIVKHRQAMYEGDEEEADELMAQLLNTGRQPATPSVDVSQIAQQAEDRAFQRMQLTQHEADIQRINKTFDKDFLDVVEDENLYTVAKQHAANLRQQSPDKPLDEVMTESGIYARKWKESIQKSSENKSRKERKRTSVRSVSGTNKTANIGKDPAPAPTRSQTISSMRQRRAGAG